MPGGRKGDDGVNCTVILFPRGGSHVTLSTDQPMTNQEQTAYAEGARAAWQAILDGLDSHFGLPLRTNDLPRHGLTDCDTKPNEILRIEASRRTFKCPATRASVVANVSRDAGAIPAASSSCVN
jgi:hypothetical protein